MKTITYIAGALVCMMAVFGLVQSVSAQTTSAQAYGCPQISYNLRLGSYDSATGNQVTCLQNFLIAKGYLSSQDYTQGYFTPTTEVAVKAFQTANSITPTGNTGPLTRASLAGYFSRGATAATPAAPTTGPCSNGAAFNYLTGQRCVQASLPVTGPCANGAAFNYLTGARCDSSTPYTPVYQPPVTSGSGSVSLAAVNPGIKIHSVTAPILAIENNPFDPQAFTLAASYTVDIENLTNADVPVQLYLPGDNTAMQGLFIETATGKTFIPKLVSGVSYKTVGNNGYFALKPGVRDTFVVRHTIPSYWNYAAAERTGKVYDQVSFSKFSPGAYTFTGKGIQVQQKNILSAPMTSNSLVLNTVN